MRRFLLPLPVVCFALPRLPRALPSSGVMILEEFFFPQPIDDEGLPTGVALSQHSSG